MTYTPNYPTGWHDLPTADTPITGASLDHIEDGIAAADAAAGAAAAAAATAVQPGDIAGLAPLASPTFTGTVAGISKAMVGLGSVDNTADTAKPVSTAQQAALNLKANSADLADVALSNSYLDLANKPSAVDIGATPQTLVTGGSAVTIGGSVDTLPGTVTNGVVVFLTGS